uniref:Uncharacterized protein n=1 Tax=Lactuca sativa TaxID=4236 RepID=A0A9R1XPP1_LACSA|nr:hypothetical protein LSAT_V11C300103150 [Lactuca sativa]
MWRLKSDPNSLWAKVIRRLHKLDGDQTRFCSRNLWIGVLKNIVKCRDTLERINIPFEDIMQPRETRDGWVSSFVLNWKFCVAPLRVRMKGPPFQGVVMTSTTCGFCRAPEETWDH